MPGSLSDTVVTSPGSDQPRLENPGPLPAFFALEIREERGEREVHLNRGCRDVTSLLLASGKQVWTSLLAGVRGGNGGKEEAR